MFAAGVGTPDVRKRACPVWGGAGMKPTAARQQGASFDLHLSYVHHLFNVDQCQAYIHTLRWKDRPLQCPRCQSHAVDPWGTYHYRPGCKRYWCNGRKRTFNDLTDTLLHHSQRSLPYWILATFLLCLSCSSRRVARELGGYCCKHCLSTRESLQRQRMPPIRTPER